MKLRRLLVPVDLGPASDRAVDLAMAFATRFDSQIVLLHAFYVPPLAYASGVYVPYDAMAESARREFDAAVAKAKARYPRVEGVWSDGDPRERIVAEATAHRADLVVMGTHGRRGMSRVLLGSVAARVLRTSGVPVLTTRAAPPAGAPASAGFGRILVATDFGEPAAEALEVGGMLAAAFSANLLVLHAYEAVSLLGEDRAALAKVEREARLAMASLLAAVRRRNADAEEILEHGDPRTLVVDVACERRADLIVMGTHARRGVARALLGSVADEIVRTSPVPVLTTGAAEG